MNSIGNISIEKFAAFLDGNLPDDEMRGMEKAIEESDLYTDILGEVMEVDDTVELFTANGDELAALSADIDIVFPEISLPAGVDIDEVEVELSVADPSESLSVAGVVSDCSAASAMPDGVVTDVTSVSGIIPEEELGGADDAANIDDNGFIESF